MLFFPRQTGGDRNPRKFWRKWELEEAGRKGGGGASDRPTDAALPHSKTVFKGVAIGNISSRPCIV